MFWPQTHSANNGKWTEAAIQNIGSHVEVEWFLWLTASACGETKNLRGLLKTLLNEGIINRMVGWIFSLCLEISYNDWIPYRQLLHDSLLPPSHLPSASDSLNNIDLNAALPLANEILITKTRKKLDQTLASLIDDIPMKLSTHYLKGLWWQSEADECIISGTRGELTSDNEWSDNCVGNKWTRVRHRGHEHVVRGGHRADGAHLASSLPPGTDPLSKNEKIFPHPWPLDYPHLFS